MNDKLVLYTDGCSKGNPGPAAIGVMAYLGNDPHPFWKASKAIGNTTNNQAEYRALICALEYAVSIQATDVEVRSDSELIVHQMNGIYRVKNADLKPLYLEAKRLAGLIPHFTIRAVPREQNSKADKLANQGLS